MKAITKAARKSGYGLLSVHKDGTATWSNGHILVVRGSVRGCPLPSGHYKISFGYNRYSGNGAQGVWTPAKKKELPDYDVVIPKKLAKLKELQPVLIDGIAVGLLDERRTFVWLRNGREHRFLDREYYKILAHAFPHTVLKALSERGDCRNTVAFVEDGANGRGRKRVRAIIMPVRVEYSGELDRSRRTRRRREEAEAEVPAEVAA